MEYEDSLDRNAVIERLHALDNRLENYAGCGPMTVVVVGGSALILNGLVGEERRTTDIDVIEGTVEIFAQAAGTAINNAVNTFVFKMPSTWRTRLVSVDDGFRNIRVLTPAAEDLVVMKLLSGRRADLDDVRDMLARDPNLGGRVRALMDDPFEVSINVEPDEWDLMCRRFEEASGEGRAHGGREER